MPMGLNIKDDRTHRLAKQLSSLTGESMTKAVTVASEERLKREAARRGRGGVAASLMGDRAALFRTPSA